MRQVVGRQPHGCPGRRRRRGWWAWAWMLGPGPWVVHGAPTATRVGAVGARGLPPRVRVARGRRPVWRLAGCGRPVGRLPVWRLAVGGWPGAWRRPPGFVRLCVRLAMPVVEHRASRVAVAGTTPAVRAVPAATRPRGSSCHAEDERDEQEEEQDPEEREEGEAPAPAMPRDRRPASRRRWRPWAGSSSCRWRSRCRQRRAR